MNPLKPKQRNEVADMLVLILQVSINMVVPIVLCTIAGVWIGNKIGVNWISVVGFFLGAIAGMQNVWRQVKKYVKNQKRPHELEKEAHEQELNDDK